MSHIKNHTKCLYKREIEDDYFHTNQIRMYVTQNVNQNFNYSRQVSEKIIYNSKYCLEDNTCNISMI